MSGGSLAGWGMDPTGLFNAGGNISNLSTSDAAPAVSGVTGALSDAEGSVHHPVVAAAIGSFNVDTATLGKQLVHNVDASGSQVKKTSEIGSNTDLDARDALSGALGDVQAGGSVLSRDINA